MKFFISILVVLFGLFQIITSKFKKNTRNYRKIASDPSYNPLPKSWESGSRNAFGGGHNLKKYKNILGTKKIYLTGTRITNN